MSSVVSTDVLIVGGGIAGCSLAYHLAAAGRTDVVVVEARQLGSGATAHSMGGVRQQFSTAPEIEVSKRGLAFWRSVEERFGVPCPFHEEGYLLLSDRPDLVERLVDAAALQQALGAGPAVILKGAQLRQAAPWLRAEETTVACHTPQDGRVNPTDGLTALAGAARRLGVRFFEEWPVNSIELKADGARVSGPEVIDAGEVVVAAGVATPDLLAPLGMEVAIRPQHLHYATTGPALQGEPVPVTIDLDTGLFVEREGEGLVVSVLHEDAPADITPEQMLDDFAEAARRRAPSLLDAGIVRTNRAAADLSLDGHPYVGRVDDRLWVLAGFAGHGTMHGPVVAEALARRMTGTTPELDLSAMDPFRRHAAPEEWLVGSRKA